MNFLSQKQMFSLKMKFTSCMHQVYDITNMMMDLKAEET